MRTFGHERDDQHRIIVRLCPGDLARLTRQAEAEGNPKLDSWDYVFLPYRRGSFVCRCPLDAPTHAADECNPE